MGSFKSEIRSTKPETSTKFEKANSGYRKHYDLEERTEQFARAVRGFARRVNLDIPNREDCKQMVRSSGSVGANYIEANEALSKKDFHHRIKICRKESKESRYWLKLVGVANRPDLTEERNDLVQEATELMLIFGAILKKSEVQ